MAVTTALPGQVSVNTPGVGTGSHSGCETQTDEPLEPPLLPEAALPVELPELTLEAVVELAELPTLVAVLLALLEFVELDCEVLEVPEALLALLTVPVVQPSAHAQIVNVSVNRSRPARTFVVDSPIRRV